MCSVQRAGARPSAGATEQPSCEFRAGRAALLAIVLLPCSARPGEVCIPQHPGVALHHGYVLQPNFLLFNEKSAVISK